MRRLNCRFERCRWSVGNLVFVDEAAKDGLAADIVLGQVDGNWRSRFGFDGKRSPMPR